MVGTPEELRTVVVDVDDGQRHTRDNHRTRAVCNIFRRRADTGVELGVELALELPNRAANKANRPGVAITVTNRPTKPSKTNSEQHTVQHFTHSVWKQCSNECTCYPSNP